MRDLNLILILATGFTLVVVGLYHVVAGLVRLHHIVTRNL